MRLKARVAIVTGGASGIGRAICELFAEQGAKVSVADVDDDGGRETVRRVEAAGGAAMFRHADVAREDDVRSVVGDTAAAFGGVDILVNDAAAFVYGTVEEVTDADWQRVMGVNVIGPSYCARHVLPHLKVAGGGSVVNIVSVSAFIAQPGFVPYNVSKAALLQLTRCMAMDLAPFNVRVNCICPGPVHTPAVERRLHDDPEYREQFEAEMAGHSVMRRMGQPREIAYGALFLASDESSYITGESLVMDGGWTIG